MNDSQESHEEVVEMAKKFPTKACPQCGEEAHVRKAVCPKCGTRFPNDGKKPEVNGESPIASAIGFIKAAGGFENARVLLAQLETIKSL